MISLKELLSGHNISDVPLEHQHNLEILLERVNKIRSAYGKPMTVTSSYRSTQDHLRIYSTKASKAGVEFDPKKVPMKSNHLTGSACDFSDPKQELQAWCLVNVSILEEVGLWCEAFEYTKNWVHFQIKPYGSWVEGKSRFFRP